jgi:hypothetical protein
MSTVASAPHAFDQTMPIEHGVMVLQAGTLTSLAKRRSNRSRILRAPQCGFSCLRLRIEASICSGNWLP